MDTERPPRAITHLNAHRDETWGPDRDGSLSLQVLGTELSPERPLMGALPLPDGSLMVSSEVSSEDNLVAVVARLNEFGEPDPTFGHNGYVLESFEAGINAGGGQMALGSDGRVIMAGWSQMRDSLDAQLAILCLDRHGNRDPGFGENGQVIIENTADRYALIGQHFVRSLSDGSILIGANYMSHSATIATLLKLNANGTPAQAFGINGRVEIKLPDASKTTSLSDCCILDNGRILVAGFAQPSSAIKHGLLAMLNANGTPNLVFGDSQTPGILLVQPDLSDTEFLAVKQRTPNTFIAAGYVDQNRQLRDRGILSGIDDFGAPDPQFNNGQLLETSRYFRQPTRWDDVHVDGDHLLTGGGNEFGSYIARIGLDGELDPGFGYEGYIEEPGRKVTHAKLLPHSTDKIVFAMSLTGIGVTGTLYRYHLF